MNQKKRKTINSHDKLVKQLQERTAELTFERKRFFDVLEMLPAYVILLTPDYHVPFANKFFRERFGESGGKRCYEYLFNRRQPCENCETYKVLKTRKPHHWEWTGPDSRNYDIFDYLFTDADGSPLIMEMGIDITEQKRAQNALKSANAYHRNLIEVSIDPLVTIDAKGKIMDVNKATEQVTGYNRGKLVGTNFADYFTEPDKARAGYKKVFKEGSIQNYELEIKHRNGHLTPVLYNASVYKNETGEVAGIFASAKDITQRRLAEDAVKQANVYHRNLIEVSLDPLVTISADGKITDVNEATIKATGIPREKLISTDFFNYFTEPQKAREGYKQVFAKGFVTDYPLTIRNKNGRLMNVLYNATVYKDTRGNVLGVFAAARDVTERSRAEEELKRNREHLEEIVKERTKELIESKERLSRAQEIAHLGSWELDVVNNRLTWSDEVYRIFGLKPQEFKATYEAFLKVIHPDDRKVVDKAYSGSLREGRNSYEIEHRVVRKSTGEIRFVHEKCEHLRDKSGKVILSVGMVHDITERKMAEEKMKHLATFPQLNPNPIIEFDKKGNFTFANLATMKVLEKLKEPKQITLFLPRNFPQMLKMLSAGKKNIFYKEINIKGISFAESITLIPALKVVRIYARDITARKIAQEALKKAHNELELKVNQRTAELSQANIKLAQEIEERKRAEEELLNARRLSDIGTLAATVAHELRNPLAAIRMASYNIKRKAKNPWLDKNLENIEIKISDSEKIINNLLFYSRLKKPILEQVNIYKILEECLVNTKAHYSKQSLKIHKQLREIKDINIEADKLQMQELFGNLLNNAYEALPATGGEIEIGALTQGTNFIKITIKDNGTGMDEESLKKVFEPFFSTKAKGTGLGLTVCYKIVQFHDGSIDVQSKKGEGTSVSIVLPIKRGENG
ncbi:MAG: PAS domain S-box protein [Candidatus Ratteibacteria bacterium]|nr:PAS domain S-box protein [Candidatus Ratteibacteria bacterium]